MSQKNDPAKMRSTGSKISKIEENGILDTVTGTKNKLLQKQLLDEAWQAAVPGGLEKKEEMNSGLAVMAMMEGIRPEDVIEGMLAAQMVATHSAAMNSFRRAELPNQPCETVDQHLKHGAKLAAIYIQQMAALDKRRGKGQQKVTVEYVNVEAGGQAIVGNVEDRHVYPGAAKRVTAKQMDDDAD